MATVRTLWQLPPNSDDSTVHVLEAGSNTSSVRALMLADLPLTLHHPLRQQSASDTQVACELALEWAVQQPLRCEQLQVEIVSSARHVELFIDGVRRSLLGEDEQGEVYLGTFRGTKQSEADGSSSSAMLQRFAVSHEFLQRDAKTNVLKEMQRLRVKFVSLTGDKTVLHLQTFKCAFVPLQLQQQLPPPLASPLFAMPAAQPALDTQSTMAAQLAGLTLPNSGVDTQTLLSGFQQLLARDLERTILRAVDDKLAALTQRLAASERRLAQLHAHVDMNGSHVHVSLAQIKQQLAELTSHAQQHCAASTDANASQRIDNSDGDVDSERDLDAAPTIELPATNAVCDGDA